MKKFKIKKILFFLFFILNNNDKINGQNLFSEIKESKIIIEDKSFNSLSFSIGLPISIVKKESVLYFKTLGEVNIEKKMIYHNISSNKQNIKLTTSIEKINKKVIINATSNNFDKNDKIRIKNLFEGMKIILKRKFFQDHIFALEKKIKILNRKQNRLIILQPKLLEKNKNFFYRLYLKNKVKKEIYSSAIQKMYSKLESYKVLIKELIK